MKENKKRVKERGIDKLNLIKLMEFIKSIEGPKKETKTE